LTFVQLLQYNFVCTNEEDIVLYLEAESLIREAFTQPRIDYLIECVQNAYQFNIPRFEPGKGDDMMLFGLMNYKTKVHNLSKLAESDPSIKVVSKQPQFVLRVGDYNLSTYCAGHSSLSDPMESFPQNKSGAAKMTAGNLVQMRIPLKNAEGHDILGDARCRNIVLADIGNPDRGLIRLFLGVPIAVDEKDRISSWGPTIDLYVAEPEESLPTDLAFFGVPPIEEIVPPTVTLKNSVTRKFNER